MGTNPRILYYTLVQPVVLDEELLYRQLYQEELKSLMDYHNSHGKDGFLSERTTLSELPARAEQRAKLGLSNAKCKYALQQVLVTDESFPEKKVEIESLLNFHKGLE